MKKRSIKQFVGFTLIELLVVVLIIGILAAVAVPQYQKAVYKSRAAEAISMLKALQQAQEVYYLANNEYTDDISKLDISIPQDRVTNVWAGTDEQHPERYMYSCHIAGTCVANVVNTNMPTLQWDMDYFTIDETTKGLFLCSNYNKNEIAESICKSLGTFHHVSDVWNYYQIN